MGDLENVTAFHDRLVGHMELVLNNRTRSISVPMDPTTATQIAAAKSALTQEYARLAKVINVGSVQGMATNPGPGSSDVIQDAINDPEHPYYEDLARLSAQRLNTIIGRLQVAEEPSKGEPSFDSERAYRLTSLLYWLARLADLVRWLGGSAKGRMVAILSAVTLTILGAVVSGWAQAFFTKVLGSSP